MANIGTGTAGKTLIGTGSGSSPTFATIGTNSGLTANGVVVGQGNGAFTATSPGSIGQVLTSNGLGVDPSFQTLGSIGAITTITGNTGGAQSPSVGNFNLLTANSTVKFAGTAATETIDFGLSNLALGSSLPAFVAGDGNVSIGLGSLAKITTGNGNTILGFGNATNITSGSLNIVIGNASLITMTVGSSNLIIGNSSGLSYTTTESDNILINNSGVAAESHKIRIGTAGSSSGQQNATFIAGITGVTVAASAPTGVDTNGQLSSLGFGTSGQVLKSTGAASSPTWQSESSYALNMITAATSPADSTTYFMVGGTTWSTSFISTARLYIPKSGTLVACYGAVNVGSTLASSENVTINIRLNNTTDTAITTTAQFTSALNPFSNNALGIAVVAGDFISFTIVTPAWVTNPVTVTFSATAFIT